MSKLRGKIITSCLNALALNRHLTFIFNQVAKEKTREEGDEEEKTSLVN